MCGVDEKPDLLDAVHERRTREFGEESGGLPSPEKNWIWYWRRIRRCNFPLSHLLSSVFS